MTLILGFNLADKLVLAADTRVTHSDGTFDDDIVKIAPIYGGIGLPMIGGEIRPAISLAVAGNLQLAQYFSDEIEIALKDGELSDDIRILSTEIKTFLEKKYDFWLTSLKRPYQNCCLLFAGTNLDRKKKIDPVKLQSLIDVFERNITPKKKLEKIKSKLENDTFFKELKKVVPISTLMEPFNHPERFSIDPKIQHALEQSDHLSEFDDALLFAVQVNKNGIIVDKAEWGEYLAYGSDGITKRTLSEDTLSKLELSHHRGKMSWGMMETSHVTSIIQKFARDKKIRAIGDIVITVIIADNRNMFITHNEYSLEGKRIIEIYTLGGNVFAWRGEDKLPMKLKPFSSYKISSAKNLTLG